MQSWGHLPQLLPEDEEVSSIVDGPRRNPLGPVAKLVEAVVDVSNELPADGELSLDVGWEEVLTGRREGRGSLAVKCLGEKTTVGRGRTVPLSSH